MQIVLSLSVLRIAATTILVFVPPMLVIANQIQCYPRSGRKCCPLESRQRLSMSSSRWEGGWARSSYEVEVHGNSHRPVHSLNGARASLGKPPVFYLLLAAEVLLQVFCRVVRLLRGLCSSQLLGRNLQGTLVLTTKKSHTGGSMTTFLLAGVLTWITNLL